MAMKDARESSADERRGTALLNREFARLYSLPELHTLTVQKGSVLWGDAQLNDYDPPDHQIVHLSGSARDHLDASRYLIQSHGLLPFAPLTLVRASVEASARALWLLTGGTKGKRVFRSLQFTLASRNDARPLAEALGGQNEAGHKHMEMRVRAIHQSYGPIRNKNLDADIATNSIVREADKFVPAKSFSGLQVWQAGSGAAHSNRTVSMMFQERSIVSIDAASRSGIHNITGSLLTTARMYEVAVDYVFKVHEKFTELASSSH